jgi:hypothetical protein
MKTSILKSVLFLALAAGAITGCINDDEYATPDLGCTETSLVKTMEVSELPVPAAPVPPASSSIVQQYLGDDIIEAYVTSSDEGGNFFKSISFQTLSVNGSQPIGFSVPVDVTSTFVNFDPGRKVLIKLKNLYVDNTNGIRIGGVFINTSGQVSVGRLPESQYREVLNRSCTVVEENDLARPMTIAQAMNNANLNTLIDLQNVQFDDASLGSNYYDPSNDIGGATNHHLTDAAGSSIIFRTSSFANFAGNPVASGNGTVRGVLTKFGSDYQFMARTERDIMLTNPRVVAFFSEDFQAAVDGTNLDLPEWTNQATDGTRVWREEAFGGNGYAEFSAFGSGNASNVAWLVSPGINMDEHTGEVMTFQTAQHHLDVDSPANSLEVYVSTDFTGDVTTATWIPVAVTLPTQATSWYEFVSSGPVDLSAYTGTLHVAFKFIGSGTNTTLDGAFQIDNLSVTGN